MQNVLIIEDDSGLRTYLKDFLIENDFSVSTAEDGSSGLEAIDKSEPDLIILDLGLPDIAGESICNRVQRDYPHIPVIILTGKDAIEDIVHGFKIGADDYITKPFEPEELLVRIQARLRGENGNDPVVQFSDLQLNTDTMEVKRGDAVIDLTPQEFKLLQYLMNNPNRVLTREMILNRIWEYAPDVETRVVDVYIGYLRKKIDNDHDKKLIHSVRGFGYILKEDE